MMDLATTVDWFGTLSGVLGVVIAIYLQLINPRRCHPSHVTALFASGSALILVFSTAWADTPGVILSTKVVAILLFVTLEAVGGYYVWKTAEMAPPQEVLWSLFEDNGGKHG